MLLASLTANVRFVEEIIKSEGEESAKLNVLLVPNDGGSKHVGKEVRDCHGGNYIDVPHPWQLAWRLHRGARVSSHAFLHVHETS